MSDQKTNRSQKKQSIPNAFEQARNTGTIGGSGQPPQPESTLIEKQISTNVDIQQTTHVDNKKNSDKKTEEEKVQQTMKIRRSLSVRVKVYVAKHPRETISNVIETALEEYLAKRENQ